MKAKPIAVAFREVRHFKSEDWLHCEPISVRAQAMGWTIPAHRHEGLHQFQWLQQGGAQAVFDGVPHALHAPVLLLMPPGCVHSFCYVPGSEGLQLTVPRTKLEGLLGGESSALGQRLALTHIWQGQELLAQTSRIAAMWDALQAEYSQSECGRDENLQAHLVLLTTWLLRHTSLSDASPALHPQRDTLVQRYRSLIEVHLRQHQPLNFYAAKLKVTPDHLSRGCRAVIGQSALDVLQDRMLLEAQRLLAFTDARVLDVARDLGFDDPSYFSRFYARRSGQSPQSYRNDLQAGRATSPS